VRRNPLQRPTVRRAAVVAALGGLTSLSLAAPGLASPGREPRTLTPIKHVVVIYGENISFDHYFGTYPYAANPARQPAFHAAAGTPSVNGLTDSLRTANPNLANPARLDRSEALTCDQDHNYTAEQKAFDHGLMDKFVENTERESCKAPNVGKPGLVMDYYDGNTVTALWNYAQHFAMSDNSYGTTFGPSTPGAINLVSGQTYGATAHDGTGKQVPDPYVVPNPGANGVGTVINDPDPLYDDCSNPGHPERNTAALSGRNVGDLLNAQRLSWGWFQGGFRPTKAYDATTGAKAQCATSHPNVGGVSVTDYVPHVSRSTTTPPPRTRTTFPRCQWLRSVTAGAPTTSTTSPISGGQSTRTTCRRSATSRPVTTSPVTPAARTRSTSSTSS